MSKNTKNIFKIIVESSRDLIFSIDVDGRIVYLNNAACRCLGSNKDNIIGKKMADFFPAEIAERQWGSIRSAMESESDKYFEREIEVSGKKVWLSTWLIPVRNPSGVVDQVIGVSRDITDLKQAEMGLRDERDKLEKLNKIMLGRELKLVEYKAELERLKKHV